MAGSSVPGQAVIANFCIGSSLAPCDTPPVSGPELLRRAVHRGNGRPVEDAFSRAAERISAFRQELDGDLQLSRLSAPGQHVDPQMIGQSYSVPGNGTQPPSQGTADHTSRVVGRAAAVRRGTR